MYFITVISMRKWYKNTKDQSGFKNLTNLTYKTQLKTYIFATSFLERFLYEKH